MSFAEGLEKTAGPARIIGQAGKVVDTAAQKATEGVKQFAKQQRRERLGGYRGKDVGSGTLNRMQNKAQAAGKPTPSPADQNKTKEKIMSRFDKSQASGKQRAATAQCSFASRHPLLTAGGVYLGARAVMGGDDQKQQSQPPPQISYY
jgi:hypothetical protein